MNTALHTYFSRRANDYCLLYDTSNEIGFLKRVKILRWAPMRWQYNSTVKYLNRMCLKEKRVLDIGCGIGNYSVHFALHGAYVTAVDPCCDMISLTRTRLKDAGVDGMVETVNADFSEWAASYGGFFELALAIGVMDYIHVPDEFLMSIKSVAHHVMISFPQRGIFTKLSHMRYRRQGFTGFSYKRDEVVNLMKKTGFTINNIIQIFPASLLVHATS